MTRPRGAFAACMSCALTALPAAAATINVPGDQPTIQDAIDAAVAGDEIVVSPGTYLENIDVNKSVTVRSVNPSSPTAVAACPVSDAESGRRAAARAHPISGRSVPLPGEAARRRHG